MQVTEHRDTSSGEGGAVDSVNTQTGDVVLEAADVGAAAETHATTHQDGGADEIALDASQITTGTLADARIPSAIARDTEVTSAVAAEATARSSAITAAIAALVNSAPGTLDTLAEIATALGNDPNLATTLSSSIAAKLATAGHDANSVIASIAGTLADLDVPASTFLGRKAAGNLVPMTVAEAKTLLAIAYADVSGLGTAAQHNHGDYDAAGTAAGLISNAAYDATAWNGDSTHAPSKDAVRDKIEALSGASVLLTGDQSVDGVKTFTSAPVAPSLKATGKTGLTDHTVELAGGAASGAPTTGTHVAGELEVDALGFPWYCTVGGTPGTWICLASGREISYVENAGAGGTDSTTSLTFVDLPANPMSIALPVLPVPCYLHFYAPASSGTGASASPANNTSGDGIAVVIFDGTNYFSGDRWISTGNNVSKSLEMWARIPAGTAAATYKIQIAAVTGGTARLLGAAAEKRIIFRAITA